MSASVSPALRRVARGNLCSGCGGCALVAPGAVEMRMSAMGYLRPVQTAPVPPRAEADIAAICPGLGQTVLAQGRSDHLYWGPYHMMQTGWSTDPDLRHRASSGGALSAVLMHLLDSGQIDGVVQTSAADTPPVANVTGLSVDRVAVLEAAGSRYAPSAPLAGLAPYLAGSGRYAFVGKPCDVAALRALAARDPRVNERLPYILSFFCAGVPSQGAAEKILEALGTTPQEVTAFRYRGMGWPGRATATLTDGSERSMTYMESWGKILSHHVQTRCKICPDGTGVAADLAFADAWEATPDGYPAFEEVDGVSLIVARTVTGQALLQAAQATRYLQTDAFDVSDLATIQPGQTWRRRSVVPRLLALRLTGRPIPKYRGLRLWAVARQTQARQFVKIMMGTLRRRLQGRI